MGPAISRVFPFACSTENGAIDLPPRPSTICRSCWKGPFAAFLGLYAKPITCSWYTQPDINHFDKQENMSGGYSYTTSWAKLESRSASGCSWCSLLLSLKPTYRDAPIGLHRLKPLRVTVGHDGLYHSELSKYRSRPIGTQIFRISLGDDRLLWFGHMYAAAEDPAAAFIVARPTVLDVGSSRSLTLARTCLADCAHGHPDCISLFGSPDQPLPTRLVDCSDPSHPHLVHTAGQCGKYVALSYVWGEDQPHKTTTANISLYTYTGIRLSQLPQTIVDAIHVTHALGCEYLWVDTFCIIQDSDADKLHELEDMHYIYRHAYVTIIAASAHKVSEGFLQLREPLVQVTRRRSGSLHPFIDVDVSLPFICPPDPHQLLRPRKAGQKTTLQVGEVCISSLFTNQSSYSMVETRPRAAGLSAEPISARAWCMQEYLLSPRTLIFTKEALRFRCATATRNVDGSFYDLWLREEWNLPYALFQRHPRVIKPNSQDWHHMYYIWGRIVEDYCRRLVTIASDKLVACGAVAAEYQRCLRVDYVAGLWRDSLVPDLLWRRDDPRDKRGPRPAAYRAPSWSWAAVDGPVVMLPKRRLVDTMMPRVEIAEVVECDVTPKDAENPFGEVVAGTLRVRAPMIPMRLLGMAYEEYTLWRRLYLESPEDALPCLRDGELLAEDGIADMDARQHDGRSADSGDLEGSLSDGSESPSLSSSQWDTPRSSEGSVNHTIGIVELDSDEGVGTDATWIIPLLRIGVAIHGIVVTPAFDHHRGPGSPEAERKVFRRVAYCNLRDHDLEARGWNSWKLPMVDNIELV